MEQKEGQVIKSGHGIFGNHFKTLADLLTLSRRKSTKTGRKNRKSDFTQVRKRILRGRAEATVIE
jgi:hypothetical protein